MTEQKQLCAICDKVRFDLVGSSWKGGKQIVKANRCKFDWPTFPDAETCTNYSRAPGSDDE